MSVLIANFFHNGQSVGSTEFDHPLDFGRQGTPGEGLYSCIRRSQATVPCCILAPAESTWMSRVHLRCEPLSDGRVRLSNLSGTLPVEIQTGNCPQLAPGGSVELACPILVAWGDRALRLESADHLETSEPEGELQSLSNPSLLPGLTFSKLPSQSATLSRSLDKPLEVEQLVRWMQTVTAVLQSAAGTAGFFSEAARALVDLVGLDDGAVLLLSDEQWRVEAVEYGPGRHTQSPPSRQVLANVRRERRTFWKLPAMAERRGSLEQLSAVVAAPICDPQGQVLGALYGTRYAADGVPPQIRRVEALLVELLAGSVAAGLARQHQERLAIEAQSRFEQFFTPELARQLAAEPDLLAGKCCEISVLFCDIRRFSQLGQHLDPRLMTEWINDVMGELSACVLDRQGVLVDYIGDELMAMWGAPVEQPDHARLACEAALDMIERLPRLNARWRERLGADIDVGIGINTGTAHVGNAGSRFKFKYSPLGNTVNLASRIQGATKHLRTRLLITDSTARGLDCNSAVRRVGQLRVVNIDQPVTVFELFARQTPNTAELKQGYEEALAEFERTRCDQTVLILSQLRQRFPQDGPALLLLARAVEALVESHAKVDPVWTLDSK